MRTFVGPGPWQILRLADAARGYEFTPDDDPRHLYDNVLVALDASRNLNNGEPAFLLRCLDDLDLSPRGRFLHVGCGVGYYTAVVQGDGSELASEHSFDAIFVNAGATEPLPGWLDRLRIGGRLLVPLTVDLPQPWVGLGAGHMLLVTRHADRYAARFTSPVGIFHCAGARTTDGNDLLGEAYRRGGHERVRSLRRDEHTASPQCWLHAARFCLSDAKADG